MNNNHHTRKKDNLYNQQNDEDRWNLKDASEMINNISIACSFMGTNLHGAIFLGVTDMLDYRNVQLISEFANCMVIVAVILFFLALLLSLFQEDSERNNSVVEHEISVGENILLANDESGNKSLDFKLKCTGNNIEVEQSTTDKNIKPTNISSKSFKVNNTSKEEEIGEKALPSSMSSKSPNHDSNSEHKEGKKVLPSNTTIKNLQPEKKSKNEKRTKAASTSTSSNVLQHNTSKQSIASKSLQSAKKGESTKILSQSTSSETLHYANKCNPEKIPRTLSLKPQSLNLRKSSSDIDRQLVPYEKPSHGQYISPNFSPRVSRFNNYMTNTLGNRPTSEIVATKKMTIFPGGVAQEEYSITQTSFYKCIWCPLGVDFDNPWCPGHAKPSESVLGPNHNNPWGPRSIISSESVLRKNTGNDNPWGSRSIISSESVLRKNTGNDNPWGPKGRFPSQSASNPNLNSLRYSGDKSSSQSVLRPNLDSSWYSGGGIRSQSVSSHNLGDQYSTPSLVLHQPFQNQISDVRTKFESMNFLT